MAAKCTVDANERKKPRRPLARRKATCFVPASTELRSLGGPLYLNAFKQVIAWHLARIEP